MRYFGDQTGERIRDRHGAGSFSERSDVPGQSRVELQRSCFARQNRASVDKKNNAETRYFGDPPGARTRDPLIKSQVLYRLS